MKYKNNDLISSTDSKGYEYTYTYDTKHNMTQAKSQRGITHNYTYNASGNPTKLIIQSMESAPSVMKIQTDMTYTEDGDYVSTILDQDGYVTTTNYDTNKGLLNSVTDSKGNTISYTYNNQNDYLTKVASAVSGQAITINYEYSNQALSKITHNGFDYNFYYDTFGNSSSVKVGNDTLESYAYNTNNGDLSKITYGNGDYKTYTYYEYGNITNVAVNGNPRYQWYTDNPGSITKHEDLLNNLLYHYEYDITGRLIRSHRISNEDGSLWSEWKYSSLCNVSFSNA